MGRMSIGRRLLSGIALATATMGYVTDWNRTHMFNPRWPPHAKFHDATTLLAGTLLGTSALVLLQRRRDDMQSLSLSAWLLSIFWISLGGSVLFPQTAEVDPEFADMVPRIAGVPIAQTAVSVVMLVLTGVGYALEWARLTR